MRVEMRGRDEEGKRGQNKKRLGALGGEGSGLGRALPVAVAFGHANSACLPHVSAYSQSGLSMATQAPGSLDQTLFGSGKAHGPTSLGRLDNGRLRDCVGRTDRWD